MIEIGGQKREREKKRGRGWERGKVKVVLMKVLFPFKSVKNREKEVNDLRKKTNNERIETGKGVITREERRRKRVIPSPM